jgi:hypothetical protein
VDKSPRACVLNLADPVLARGFTRLPSVPRRSRHLVEQAEEVQRAYEGSGLGALRKKGALRWSALHNLIVQLDSQGPRRLRFPWVTTLGGPGQAWHRCNYGSRDHRHLPPEKVGCQRLDPRSGGVRLEPSTNFREPSTIFSWVDTRRSPAKSTGGITYLGPKAVPTGRPADCARSNRALRRYAAGDVRLCAR